MELTDFGWRDGLLLAIVLAVVYLLVALLGLARLRRRHDPTAELLHVAPRVQGRPNESGGTAETGDERTVPGATAAPFAAHLALTELEAEVGRLRADIAAMREELAELKAAGRVSPLYADAVALARRGFDARGVAAECGISVAEAELVMAMSRDEKAFGSERDQGEHGGRDGKGLAAGR